MSVRAKVDVRRTNWWYVVPPAQGTALIVGDKDQAEGFSEPLVADPGSVPLAGILADGPFSAVAVPDLDRLAAADDGALQSLAHAVADGGWLYGGFSNRPLRRGALSVGRVRRVLRGAGFGEIRLFLTAPDHITPAYMIPGERRAEMDFFLRVLFFPYTSKSGARAAAKRLSLRFLWLGARISPPSLRARAWPSVAFVARRRRPR